MGNLSRGIRIQIWSISQHAAKASDIDSLLTMEHCSHLLLQLRGILPLIECGNRDISQLFNFTVSESRSLSPEQQSTYQFARAHTTPQAISRSIVLQP